MSILCIAAAMLIFYHDLRAEMASRAASQTDSRVVRAAIPDRGSRWR